MTRSNSLKITALALALVAVAGASSYFRSSSPTEVREPLVPTAIAPSSSSQSKVEVSEPSKPDAVRSAIVSPQNHQRLKEGEISLEWTRPNEEVAQYKMTLLKSGKPIYSRKTNGTRRTKYLSAGKYELIIKKSDGNQEQVSFEIIDKTKIVESAAPDQITQPNFDAIKPDAIKSQDTQRIVASDSQSALPLDQTVKTTAPLKIETAIDKAIDSAPDKAIDTASDKGKSALEENNPIQARLPLQAECPPIPLKDTKSDCRSHLSEFWISLGIGANYTHIEQKRTELNANYRGISGPSLLFESGIAITESTAFAASFKKTSGTSDNSGLGGGKLTYEWNTIGVEGQTLLSACRSDTVGYWTLLYGFQHHSLPIVSYAAFTYDPSLKSILYLNTSLGLRYQYFASPKKFFSIYGRYQYPISSSGPQGATLTMTSPIMFDGSVGGEYKLTEALWAGIYWYGQLHSYKIRYAEGFTLNEGTQNMFYSNVEFRLNLRF